jgi:hypothetical protein
LLGESVPEELAGLGKRVARVERVVVVLALIVIPHAIELAGVGEAGDVDATVAGATEALHLAVHRLQAIVRPFLDEALPLVCRIEEKLLLGRDVMTMERLVGGQDSYCSRRWWDVLQVSIHGGVAAPSACSGTADASLTESRDGTRAWHSCPHEEINNFTRTGSCPSCAAIGCVARCVHSQGSAKAGTAAAGAGSGGFAVARCSSSSTSSSLRSAAFSAGPSPWRRDRGCRSRQGCSRAPDVLRSWPEVADWREVPRIVLHIDPEREPDRARAAFDSHLARAKWMSGVGCRHLLRYDDGDDDGDIE